MSNGLPVSLAELLEVHEDGIKSDIFTGLPAKVVKYDPITNVVDAEIVVKNAVFDRDWSRRYEKLPILPSVPVLWPRAGGMICRLPLEPGDFVWLAFSKAGLAEWRMTGQLSEPRDARQLSIGYAYAIPGAFPDVEALNPLDAVAVAAGQAIFGEDGGNQVRVGPTGIELAPAGVTPIMPVALAPPVVTAIAAIGAWCAALQAAMTANTTVPTVQAAMVGPTATLATALGLVAGAVPSTLVKAT